MKLFNSLSGKKEEFIPVQKNKLSLYVCGPTVYNYIHIGNARPVIFFDVLRRYFEFLGYEVTYTSNVTDVDDKIIQRAIQESTTEKDIAEKYIKAFFEDVEHSGSLKPHVIPRATEYIEQMIKFIGNLVETNHAYVKDGDVYFRVSSIPNYGILSNQNTDDLEVGARITDHDKKESPLDFTLWKKTDVGIKWDSPWGKGRPGWHTECVVMIDSIFGGKIDIHGGGVDLKFPHHENEIAQCEALHDHTIANYFMHVGRVSLNSEKMSKSIGNVVWLKDLLKNHKANAYRMLLLSSNYRQPLNFSDDLMAQFDRDYEKIERSYRSAFLKLDLEDAFTNQVDEEIINCFKNNMDDDFNTPNVITILFELTKKINTAIRNKEPIGKYFETLKVILNTLGMEIHMERLSKEDKELYNAWNEARINKDFEKADSLRKILSEKGII